MYLFEKNIEEEESLFILEALQLVFLLIDSH